MYYVDTQAISTHMTGASYLISLHCDQVASHTVTFVDKRDILMYVQYLICWPCRGS
jgi:hypothetical protein